MEPYIARVSVAGDAGYATQIPAIAALATRPLVLDPRLSFFVGDNGSGKSTLVEAIAVASKLNAEGGGKVMSLGFRAAPHTPHCTGHFAWKARSQSR